MYAEFFKKKNKIASAMRFYYYFNLVLIVLSCTELS